MSIETKVLEGASKKMIIIMLIMLIPTAYTFGAEMYNDNFDNTNLDMLQGLCMGILLTLAIVISWVQNMTDKANEEIEAIDYLVKREWTVLDREEIDSLTRAIQRDERKHILCPDASMCRMDDCCPDDTDEIKYVCPQIIEEKEKKNGLTIA